MVFHKYPKIGRFGETETSLLLESPDDLIYIEEKIDGANFRFMLTDEGRIIFGSRNQSICDDTEEIGGSWARCVRFIKDKIKDKELSKYTGHIFYGECCIPHSIKYNWDTIPPFLGFDILVDGAFIDFDAKLEIYSELGLPVVPSFPAFTAEHVKNMIFSENDIPISEYGNGLKAEGIVLKNYRTQTFLKFVSSKFKEVNKATFGSSPKFAADDNEKLIAVYCTNPRIYKQIFKLIDDGNELDMRLMQYLPMRVWDDIVEEHSEDILHKDWKLDIRACRKGVSKRCLGVLEQIISLGIIPPSDRDIPLLFSELIKRTDETTKSMVKANDYRK